MTFTIEFCSLFAVMYTISTFTEKDPVRRSVYSVGTIILCAIANLAAALSHLVK